MAILKKGSKGKEVERLQKLLNQSGAKLKEDGIFGPLTEKATMTAQKRLKTKVDGKAGDYTMASLKFGKELPKMEVPDMSKSVGLQKLVRKHNEGMVGSHQNIKKSIDALDKVSESSVAWMTKALAALAGPRQQTEQIVGDIVKAQAEYDANLLSNPIKAAKAAHKATQLAAAHKKYLDAMKDVVDEMAVSSGELQTAINTFKAGAGKELQMMKKSAEKIHAQVKMMRV
ncbi:MAG: peptidoglycan-binding domain-containing protein [Pseudomonadota bacterium]